LANALVRENVNYLPIPLKEICLHEFANPAQRQLFKNIVYIGALAAFLKIDFKILTSMVSDQFRGKEKLILPNIHALELGHQYAIDNFKCPLRLQLKRSNKNKGKILMDGNTAVGLGCVYGGATIASWYPLTPSTSVVDSFDKYCKRLRIDPGTGKKKYSIIQAEDELAAIGIAIGAGWNGARAFTASSGPGVSLMQEFLGLAYFSEVPLVLFNIQRVGPSTGMPTRTQQGDLLSCAYASHGDTKHILLFPATPKECFQHAADSFDIADRLQTPVIVMSDLELGMNEQICDQLVWDDSRIYDRGKVLTSEQLEEIEDYGRYQDVDADGIPYRTYPGTNANKGSYFTRGSSHDANAAYTEDGNVYAKVMDRLARKFRTALNYLPEPEISDMKKQKLGMVFIGSTNIVIQEVLDNLGKKGIHLDTMRIKAFPFHKSVKTFIDNHELVYVIDQNRDSQLKSLLKLESNINEEKMYSIANYNGVLITARYIEQAILGSMPKLKKSSEVPA
jgi:2-oxoglutarate ferredoxin oxidoreductase subunit alpha